MDRRTCLRLAAGAALVPAASFAQDTYGTPGKDPATETAPDSHNADTVAGLIANERDLDTLAALLMSAELVDTLSGPGPFTVFAPVNSAFEKLGEPQIAKLEEPENAERLKELLGHHVVADLVRAEDLTPGSSLKTMAGPSIRIAEGETLLIGGAKLLKPGLETRNGVVHKIDTVLMPTQA